MRVLGQARLRQVLTAILAAFMLLAAMNLAKGAWLAAGLELTTVALLVAAYRLNERHRAMASAWLTLGSLLLMLLGLMVAGQGLYDEAFIAFPGLLLFASMFGSHRLSAALLAVMLAALAGLYGAHQLGFLPSVPHAIDASRPLALATILVVTGIFVMVVKADQRHLLAQLDIEKHELMRSHARIEELAYRDMLTGLPNRTLALHRLDGLLAQAQRDQTLVGVMLLDLDHFKTINDGLGHARADALLRAVATRLRACVRPGDTVARLAGDEFAVLLGGVRDEQAFTTIANKLLAQFDQPFALDDMPVHTSCSLGIAIHPRDGGDGTTLLKHADLAMSQSKSAGRNTFRFFDEQMNASLAEQLQLSAGLRNALECGQLQLHYQPKIDLASGRITSAEALMRWHHPEQSWISPERFIPVAERAGMIEQLGNWALHQACTDLLRWQAQGLHGIRVAVNVSPLQFLRTDMAHTVTQVLRQHGVTATSIELEITESVLLGDTARLSQTLDRLHDLGVQVAIDDFGTGYSNLAYLQRLAVQHLKIDRSFTRDIAHEPQTCELVRAIIEMARCLGLRTVAEGVEDAPTQQLLQTLGCDVGQGFHWSAALSAQSFADFVRRHHSVLQPALATAG